MVDVLRSKVHVVVRDIDRISVRRKAQDRQAGCLGEGRVGDPGACGHHWAEQADAVREVERQGRHNRANSEICVLQRADPDGLLPAQLGRIGRLDNVVPGDTVEHLGIEAVDVDRVCVDTVVGDLPDLGAVIAGGDRRDLYVCFGQIGRVDNFRDRAHVWIQNRVGHARCGRDDLHAKDGTHAAELVEV